MNPFTIDPHDRLKRNNLERSVRQDTESIGQLINEIDQSIDDITDITSDEYRFKDHPDTENVNTFLDKVKDDTETAKESIEEIPGIISQEFNFTVATLEIIQTRINEIQPTLANLDRLSRDRGFPGRIYISDNFLTDSFHDQSFPIQASIAFVDNTLGSVTLNRQSGNQIVPTNFKVLRSNKDRERDINNETPFGFFYEGNYYGYPQEIIAEGGDLKLKLTTNPTRVISEPATDRDKDAIRTQVFDGKIDTAWVCEFVKSAFSSDNEPLVVDVLIDMGAVDTISNIAITPYLLHAGDVIDVVAIRAGVNTGELLNVEIHRNRLTQDRLESIDQPVASSGAENSNYNQIIDLSFDSIEARYIQLSLQQRNTVVVPYNVLEVTAVRENPASGVRENLRVTLGYLQSLALSSTFGSEIAINDVLSAILNLGGNWSINPTNLIAKQREDREHQAIGVSEITIGSAVYEEVSEFVSVAFRAPKTVTEVRLNVDEIIPTSFPAGSWIDYEVSFDGNTFFPIAASGAGRDSSDRPLVVKPKESVSEIRVKAILKRPSNLTGVTPVLKGYQLEVKT